MDSAVHAARGALAAGGGLTLLQSLLARRLRKPSGLALAVGGFVGTFRFLESLGNEHLGSAEAARRHVPSASAGVAALVAVYFLEAKKKGLLLSYAALEAMLLLVKEHTSIADWKHIQAPMAVLALHRVIYVWIYESDMLTKSQLATLDGLTLVPPDVLTRVRAELPVNPQISRCELFHGGQTCTEFHTGFLRKHYKTAMKLYIPIYFFSAVLTKYDKWIWGPRPRVRALVLQYLRTCASLSLSFCIPLGVSCISPIKHHRTTVVVAGMVAGLAMAFEHEKRRATVIKSIALYPIAAAGARVAHTLALSPRAVALWQYVVFSFSMAVLFQRPERQNARIMRLLFGHRVRASTSSKETKGKAAETLPSPNETH